MLKQIKDKTKNKTIIIINIVLISVLIVVAVYAWFSAAADNSVDAYEVEVVADDGLQLSFDEETWSSSLNLSTLKDGSGEYIMQNIAFANVTSDGVTFLTPSLTQFTNYALPNTSAAWTEATANTDYLEFTVYMKSSEALTVFFSSDSYASPVSTAITGSTSGNKSSYGDFSKDCVVGALRVAAFADTEAANADSSNKKFVWITNPDYHLTNTVGSDEYEMDTGSTSGKYTAGTNTEGGNFAWNDSYTHYYYTASSGTTEKYTLTTDTDALSSIPDIVEEYNATDAETLTLATLSDSDNDGTYTGQATFRVWLEGCDTEARRALVNGKFNLSLKLDSFEPSS